MKNPFITSTVSLGPLTLRDLTAQDCVSLADMKPECSDLETLLIMVWMATLPVEEVEQAVGQKTAAGLAKQFIRWLPMRLMARAKNWALEQQQMQEDAKVEIIEQSSIDTSRPPN